MTLHFQILDIAKKAVANCRRGSTHREPLRRCVKFCYSGATIPAQRTAPPRCLHQRGFHLIMYAVYPNGPNPYHISHSSLRGRCIHITALKANNPPSIPDTEQPHGNRKQCGIEIPPKEATLPRTPPTNPAHLPTPHRRHGYLFYLTSPTSSGGQVVFVSLAVLA